MKDKGECAMNLVEWHDYLGGDNWLYVLAPGGGENKDAQVAAAIANLDDPCFKFLLTEKLDDGLEKLTTLPDFARLNATLLPQFCAAQRSARARCAPAAPLRQARGERRHDGAFASQPAQVARRVRARGENVRAQVAAAPSFVLKFARVGGVLNDTITLGCKLEYIGHRLLAL